jgi:predicted O-methyltransferase YrrM
MNERYLEIITQYPTAWLDHRDFAINLVKTIQPKIILDLGVDFGYSTFCWAYNNIGKVYGVDCFCGTDHPSDRDAYNKVIRTKDQLSKEFNINVEIITSKFDNFSKSWNDVINILHIDGDHSYEMVKNDFELFSSYVPNEGVILFHDTLSHQDTVGKFFERLDGYKFNRTESYGLGVYTKSKETYEKIRNL